MPMLPSAAQQFRLEVVSSLVSPIHRSTDSHVCDPKDGSGDDLSIRGRGCHHHGCPGPKYANACGSRRRMTPLSRSDPVLRFVRHAKDLLAGAMQVASTERNDRTPVVSGGSKEWAVCPRWTCQTAPKICLLKPFRPASHSVGLVS